MKKLFFLHIPKTGGTSISELLVAKSGLPLRILGLMESILLPQVLDRFDCIGGHLPLFVRDLIGDQRPVFTVVRNPIRRTISAINHILSEEHHHLHPLIMDGPVELMRSANSGIAGLELSNLQVRLLGFRPSVDILARARAGDIQAQTNLLANYMTTEPRERELDNAIDALKEDDVSFGLFENLAFTIDRILGDLLGASHGEVPHLRRPIRCVEETEELLRIVGSANQLDLELYKRSVDLFVGRLAAYFLDGRNLIDEIGGPCPFQGLYNLEQLEGRPFRWSNGAARLQVHLPIDCEQVRIEVELLQPSGQIDADDVRLIVDNNVMPCSSTTDKALRFDATCYPRPAGPTRIVTVEIWSSTRMYDGDARILGVPITHVRFRKCVASASQPTVAPTHLLTA